MGIIAIRSLIPSHSFPPIPALPRISFVFFGLRSLLREVINLNQSLFFHEVWHFSTTWHEDRRETRTAAAGASGFPLHPAFAKNIPQASEVQKMFRSFAMNLESQTTEMKRLGKKTPGVEYWISDRMYTLLDSFDLGERFSFPKKFT